jgi:hypothetical protein
MYPQLLLPACAPCQHALAAAAVEPTVLSETPSDLPAVAPPVLLVAASSLLLHAALLPLALLLVPTPEDCASVDSTSGCPICQPGRASSSDSSLSADLKGPEQEGQGMPLARSTSAVHLHMHASKHTRIFFGSVFYT